MDSLIELKCSTLKLNWLSKASIEFFEVQCLESHKAG